MREIRGSVRRARVSIKDSTFETDILEVSTSELMDTNGQWPSLIRATGGRDRPVDGLAICYDASDPASWDMAKLLLGELSFNRQVPFTQYM